MKAVIRTEELTKLLAAARQQGFEEGKQAGRDEVLTKLSEQEPEAHMYPSDLEKFSQSETFATAFSVAVGNPDENSIPMIRQPNKPDKE
jgi:flagellar biosynthesis/type III secretory pathway protein FliH